MDVKLYLKQFTRLQNSSIHFLHPTTSDFNTLHVKKLLVIAHLTQTLFLVVTMLRQSGMEHISTPKKVGFIRWVDGHFRCTNTDIWSSSCLWWRLMDIVLLHLALLCLMVAITTHT
eukprot:Lithocolla_globosa_v1_NODE_1444_length_2570_cov_57.409145.p2 type:complete len:116 gc:universal NODE_1444_length_2570_cov_57.409145:1924-2271(+)